MLKNITLGQYFPGDTILHRLDPRMKIICTILYITAVFMANSLFSMAVVALFFLCLVQLSAVKMRLLVRGLRPLMIIFSLTAILNLFFTPGEVLVSFWRLSITREGIFRGIIFLSRISLMVMGTFLLTYTTSPMAFTDGLEKLLAPLKKIRVPVHELAMIMSMALRFVPTLLEETDKIIKAQKARGADFESGGLFRRARALIPIFVPLFISAFRRADELAIAMESRCYHGGEGRTRMRQLRYVQRDALAFLICAVFVVGIWWM